MFNQGQLRDAFNRDVFPNKMQPGSYSNSNGGPSAAFSGGPDAFNSSGSFSSYGQSGGHSSEWPSYEGGGFDAGSGYSSSIMNSGGSMSGSSGYESCEPCNEGRQYNPPNQQQFQQPSSYAEVIHNLNHSDPVQTRNNHLSASHASVNEMLVNYLRKTVELLSSQLRMKPDWVDLSPDGGASWKYSTMIQGNSIWCRVFTRVEVHAERKAYKRPLPHIGNITTTTKIKLDCDLINELQKEFPMMSYCPSTKTLQITMDSLEHNLAMLALICCCQKETISLSNIKYYELPKKYLLLTTPGNKRYKRGAKYSLIRQIRS